METVDGDFRIRALLRTGVRAKGPDRQDFLSHCPANALIPAKDCESRPLFFDARLQRFETAARQKFSAAVADMPQPPAGDRFFRHLDEKIIPAFARIGFDAPVARVIFQAAGHVWRKLGPLTHTHLWCDPALIRDIRQVRRGVISAADGFVTGPPSAGHFRRPEKPGRNTMRFLPPQRDNAPSWILLPRMYHLLENHHAHCLPGYLGFLDRETHPEFRKILVRIIIEFTGNFTMKHLSDFLPRHRMVAALLNGYTAMFWKNLRNPPPGFEDALVFSHLFRWVKLFCSRSNGLKPAMGKTLEQMVQEKQKVWPEKFSGHSKAPGDVDVSRFLVTLRHGRPGINAVMGYLGICANLPDNVTGGGLPYTAVPSALTRLFAVLKQNYAAETPVTRKTIRQFLCRLRRCYRAECACRDADRTPRSDTLRFVIPRALALIDEAAATMH